MTTGTYEVRTARRWQHQLDIPFPDALALVRDNSAALELNDDYWKMLTWSQACVKPFAAHMWEPHFEQVAAVPLEVRSAIGALLYDVVPDAARLAGLLPIVDRVFSNAQLLSSERLRLLWRKTEQHLSVVVDCLPAIVGLATETVARLNDQQTLPNKQLAALADRYVRLLATAIRSAEDFGVELERFIIKAGPQRDLYAPCTPWTSAHETLEIMWHCSSRLEHYAGGLLGEERAFVRRTMRPFPADEDERIVWF